MMIEIHNFGMWEILALAASLGVLLGHNFWLIGGKRGEGERPRVEAHVGHYFPVSESAISPERIADFKLISSDGVREIKDCRVEGTALIAEIDEIGRGSQMAAITLYPRPISLEPKIFAEYLAEEETALDLGSGGIESAQEEIYSKYAKAILVNHPEDEIAQRILGQKMEIVLEQNPALLSGERRLSVRVLFDGEPIADIRVSSGCERIKSGGYASHVRTNEEGRAKIELPAGGHWFIRAHYIRPHPDPKVARWESFWPSLTFHLSD